jgi:hypothetical protein
MHISGEAVKSSRTNFKRQPARSRKVVYSEPSAGNASRSGYRALTPLFRTNLPRIPRRSMRKTTESVCPRKPAMKSCHSWSLRNFQVPLQDRTSKEASSEFKLGVCGKSLFGVKLTINALCADVVRRFTRRFKDTPRVLRPLAGIGQGRRSLGRCGSLLSNRLGRKMDSSENGFDHTLITPRACVGVLVQKRRTCIHLESVTYDWLGLLRTERNGFHSPPPTW